jgi:hypothetical protein
VIHQQYLGDLDSLALGAMVGWACAELADGLHEIERGMIQGDGLLTAMGY